MKKLILVFLLLASPAFAGPGYQVFDGPVVGGIDFSSDANLQGWWNFEDNLTDGSGKSNTPTNQNGTTTYSSDTMVKNGSNSLSCSSWDAALVNASQSANLPGKQNYTVSAMTVCGWVRASNVTDLAFVIGNVIFLGDSPWMIYISSSHATFAVQDEASASKSVTNSSTLSTNTTYFIAGVWDGSYVRIYTATEAGDVSEDGTATACSSMHKANTPALWMGGVGTSWYLPGYMDDWAVFNRALSLSELRSIKNNGLNNSH
jgi:hypothetical protein